MSAGGGLQARSRRAAMAVLVAAAVGMGGLQAPASAAALAPLPSTERSSPAVVSLSSGRVDLFWRSAGGDLIHQYRPAGGSWTRSLNLGGDLVSQPAVVSWAPGRLDVFARGADNALWHRWYTSDRWSRWESLGGTLTSAPAVASWAPGRLDVFARGSGNTLRHKWFVSGSGWSGWRSLGGTLYSQPAVASPADGQLDVVMRGAKAMWLKRYVRGSGWGSWTSLGGSASSGPAAVAIGSSVRVAAKWPNGRVYQAVRSTPGGAWGAWTAADPYRPFRRLGTWVDVFDYGSLDPTVGVADMRAHGVRTLYLSTARFDSTTDFFDVTAAGQWLDAAHAAGIRVVGWYVPAYGNMARDVRRTVAIADFVSPAGQRFDAVGIDIERLDEVTRAQFNTRLVTHLQQVRAQSDAVIGAIVPSPFATDPGANWQGFPWAQVGSNSDVVVPMALWSFRDSCPGDEVCPYTANQVYAWVLDQVRRARSLSGRPVSVEGGVDDVGSERTPVTAARVSRFVDAAVDGGAIGGSHYDYATTDPAWWPILARLNGL